MWHDAYVWIHHPLDVGARLELVRHVLPPCVVVCGRTALWLHGLELLHDEHVPEVLLPRGVNLRRKEGLHVRSALTPAEELVDLGGLLVVSPARAVVDVARSEGLHESVGVADAAVRSGLATPGLIADSLERAAGLRHVRRARLVLDHLEPRSESVMESRLRMVMVDGGLPRPEAQVDFYDEAGMHLGRADLAVDGAVFEYDGFAVHDRRAAFVRDRRRGNALSSAGLEVRRFTADDVLRRPGFVVATARQAVEVARGRVVSAVRGPDTLRPPRLAVPGTVADRRTA